jgi:type II secretory pathway pseudopilin PulG
VKNQRGFTIVEMLVVTVVTMVIMAITMSFFVFYSRQSYNVTWNKRAEEAVEMTAMMIRKDIMGAGYGVLDQPELTIYVDDSDANRCVLYVSNARYLNTEANTESIPDALISAYLGANSVYNNQREFTPDGGATTIPYQGYFNITDSTPGISPYGFTLNSVPMNVGRYSIGGLVVFNAGSVQGYRAWIEDADWPPATGSIPGTRTITYATDGSLATGQSVAPAVRYYIDNQTDAAGNTTATELFRNNLAVFGADQRLNVTRFSVRAQFMDDLGFVSWSPDNGSFGSFPLNELRMVEVTLAFTKDILGGGEGARIYLTSNTITRVITATPRALMLNRQET